MWVATAFTVRDFHPLPLASYWRFRNKDYVIVRRRSRSGHQPEVARDKRVVGQIDGQWYAQKNANMVGTRLHEVLDGQKKGGMTQAV
jgi:hypothetical protein